METIKREYEEAKAEQDAVNEELIARRDQLSAQVTAACELIANLDELSQNAQAEYDAIALAEDEAMPGAFEGHAGIRRAAGGAENIVQRLDRRRKHVLRNGILRRGYVRHRRSIWEYFQRLRRLQRYLYLAGGQHVHHLALRRALRAYCGSFHKPQGDRYRRKVRRSDYAAADGQVASATYNNGLGYYVSIEHDGETATRYSHMTNFIVQPGEHVKQGQIIGYVGESGIATGSHLDYAVIKNGQQVDPMQYYDESTVTYDPTA